MQMLQKKTGLNGSISVVSLIFIRFFLLISHGMTSY